MRRRRDDRLRRLPMFRGASDREVARVLALADLLDVASQHVLVREGEYTSEFYVVVTGQASVTRGDKLLALLGPGDYCGELASLDPAPRNATVTMVTDGTVLSLCRREFETLLGDMPGLARRLLSGLAGRVHQLDVQA
jgi:CRP/FNR family transcriptional regulator, cyclic AMP receptor protein